MKQPVNVINSDPDYMMGWKSGQPVLVPKNGDGDIATFATDPLTGAVTGLVGPGGAVMPLVSDAVLSAKTDHLSGFKYLSTDVATSITLPNPYSSQPNEPIHPAVLFFEQGWNGYRYWLAFTPYPGFDSVYENPSVVASNDFATWVAPATNPLVPKPGGVGYNADTHLFMSADNSIMYLCFRERNVSSANNLKVMETTDGRTWSTPVTVLTGTLGVQDFGSPSIWWNGTGWTCISHNLDAAAPWPIQQRISSTSSIYGAWSAATTVSLPALAGRAWWHSHIFKLPSGQVLGLFQDNNQIVGNSGSVYIAESGDDGATFGLMGLVGSTGGKYRSCGCVVRVGVSPIFRVILSNFSDRTLSYYDVRLSSAGTVAPSDRARELLAFPSLTNGSTKLVDTFTRADSAVSIGTASSGQSYSVSGTWGIISNSAYAVAAGNATVDMLSTAYTYGVQFAGMQTAVQLWSVFRFVSATDCWRVGVLNPSASGAQTLTLQSVVGGAVQLNTSIGNITRGDHLGIINTPSGFRVYVNDALVHTRVDSLHCQGTSVGLRANSMTAVGFKYLTCESLA